MTDVATRAALDDRETRVVLDRANRTRLSDGERTFDARPAEAYVVPGEATHADENREDDLALAIGGFVPPRCTIWTVGRGSR